MMPRSAQQADDAPRRIGRPPKVKAAETRERVIEIARGVFAERGFDVTTNKELAEAVGFTTAALYYHFPSKLDLYLAVWSDTQEQIYRRFEESTAMGSTFRQKLDLLLDAAHSMNGQDPSLAQFVAAVRVDMRRHPEIVEGYSAGATVRDSFFERLISFGVSTGEIGKGDKARVHAALLAFLIGLNDAMSDDQRLHQHAIDGLRDLLSGSLLHKPAKTPARTGRR
jgi:AcrR family transcriptional regulator